jgi:2-polyprenyl-3-methyl-5-hydroxy-6-metoxy-1,4-benzoquinol methylase
MHTSHTLRQDEQAVEMYDKIYSAGEHIHEPVWVDDFVRGVFRQTPRTQTIVDVGCGTGRMVQIAHELGFSAYVGVDLSKEAIKCCEHAFPQHTFYQCDIHTMGEMFPATFGAFFLTAMLMHIARSDAPNALRSLRSSLRHGADGLIATPKGSRPKHTPMFKGFLQTLYTKDELVTLLEQNGFKPTHIRTGDTMLVGHIVAT